MASQAELNKVKKQRETLRKHWQRANYALATQAYKLYHGKTGTDKQRRKYVNWVTPDKIVADIKKTAPKDVGNVKLDKFRTAVRDFVDKYKT